MNETTDMHTMMSVRRKVKDRFDAAKHQIQVERDELLPNSQGLDIILDDWEDHREHGDNRGEFAYWCQSCESFMLADERPKFCVECDVEGDALTEVEPVDVEDGGSH
jgi:hypothetical protein